MTVLLVILLLFESVHSACFKDKANQSTTWEWSGSIGTMHQGIDSSEKCLELCLDSYTCVATNYKIEERTCYLFNFMVKEETCLTPCKSMMIDLPVPESCQQIKNNVNPYHKRFLLESCLPPLELCKTTMKLKGQFTTMDKNMEQLKRDSNDKVNELKQTHKEDKERLEIELNNLKQTLKYDKERLEQSHKYDKNKLKSDFDEEVKNLKKAQDKHQMYIDKVSKLNGEFFWAAVTSDPSWNIPLDYIPDFTDIEKTSANFLKESTYDQILYGISNRSAKKVKIYRSPMIQRFVRVENLDNQNEYIYAYDEDRNILKVKEGIFRYSWPDGRTALGSRLFSREGRKDDREYKLYRSRGGDIYYYDKIYESGSSAWKDLAKHKFNPDNLTWTKQI